MVFRVTKTGLKNKSGTNIKKTSHLRERLVVITSWPIHRNLRHRHDGQLQKEKERKKTDDR